MLNSCYFELRIKLIVSTTYVPDYILFYINFLAVKVKLSFQQNSKPFEDFLQAENSGEKKKDLKCHLVHLI